MRHVAAAITLGLFVLAVYAMAAVALSRRFM